MTRPLRRTGADLRRLIMVVSVVCVPWLLGGCAGTPTPQLVAAAPPPPPATMDTYIAEASQRFNVPEKWIRAVMAQESGGRTHVHGQPIVSNKGAMGLMQVMPATWAYLRDAYKLGNDPFDPHDNIMAGTAYIREMFDQYGSPGFLAAYNAGPGRYETHLRTHRPLPGETRHYVAVIAPKIDGIYPDGPSPTRRAPAGSAPVAVAALPPSPNPPAPAPEPVREPARAAVAAVPEPVRTPPPAEPPHPIVVASAESFEPTPPPLPAVRSRPAAVADHRPAGTAQAPVEHRGSLPPGWYVPAAYTTK